jgi:hypothetical protein
LLELELETGSREVLLTARCHPVTTNTSNEYPSIVENACASWMSRPSSPSKHVSCKYVNSVFYKK